MYKDQKIFTSLQYKKCHQLSRNFLQSDKTIKQNIPKIIYNTKSSKYLNEHYHQKNQHIKKQLIQIKNKTNINQKISIKMQKDEFIQRQKDEDKNIRDQKDFEIKKQRYLRQQNQQQFKMDIEDNNKFNKLSRTQPTNFLSQSELLSQQSQSNCPQLNILKSTCLVQQLLVNSDRLLEYKNTNQFQSPKKFINQGLDIDVSFPPTQKNRKTILTQDKNQDKLNFNNKNNNIPKMSKSLMAQKILNLRKTFNKRHNAIQSTKSDTIQKRVYYQINKQLAMKNYQQKSIQSLNFPLLNQEEHKKMSFNQLFQYEKKKMENLKKLLNKTKLDQSIDLESNSMKLKSNDLDNILRSKNSLKRLISEQANNNETNLLSHSESKNSYLLYPIKGKNHFKNRSIQSYRKGLSIYQQQSNPQRVPIQFMTKNNLSNLKVNLNSLSTEKQPKSQSKRRKKHSISHVTTYNFDYIQKQKPQIKQLRSKYLYTNKKKFNKEDLPQSLVAIASISKGQNLRIQKWKNKLSIESYVQDFLEVQKIPPLINITTPKTSVKITKEKCNKRKNYQTVESQKEKCQNMELVTFRQKFQPWQNQKQNQQILDDDICQFSI